MASTLLVVAGCTEVGPDYVRPQTPTPASYKEASAHHAPTAPADKWWEIYGDADLNALVLQVEVNNQTLAVAAARVRESQALLGEARGALVPAVTAGTLKSGRKNENDFGIGVSWELDLWGRVRRDVEAHRATAQASEADLAAATLSMQAQLVQSYFALRQADALLVFAQHAADADERWNRIVENQNAQGFASSAEVSQALNRSSASQLQLVDVRTSRAQLEHAIAVMIGKPPAEFSVVPAPFVSNVPEIPADVPASLLTRRPDIVASERRMAAASARIGVVKAGTLPSINLAAGIGVLRGPTATADVRAPLFAGGRLDAQIDYADAGFAEAVASYQQTVLDAYREVEDSLVAANSLAEVADKRTRAAAAAIESERVTRNQFKEGVADYPAVVDAASAAFDAGRGDLQLRLRRLDASVNLIKSLGGSWRIDAATDPNTAR